MAVFSVHLPGGRAADVADAAFVREGFSRGAFLLGPVWLLGRGLWLWAALWFAAVFALFAVIGAGVLSAGSALPLLLLLQAWLGLEAGRLVERRLWRQGYDLAEIVAAPHRDEAEIAFFRRFGAAAEPPQAAAAPVRRPPSGVIGSLPAPEA